MAKTGQQVEEARRERLRAISGDPGRKLAELVPDDKSWMLHPPHEPRDPAASRRQ